MDGVNVSLKAESLFHAGTAFPLTNSFVLGILVLGFLAISGLFLNRGLALAPSGFQNLAEIAIEGLLGLMDSVLGDRRKSEKYLPLVGTIFIMVLFANWMGLIPGVGSIGLREGGEFVPLLRSPSADLNFTLAIALISVIATNVFAVKAIGAKSHFKKYLNFSNPVYFFVGILEFVSECAKIVSFSFRLFGNVFAGEVLLIIMGFLAPYLVPVPFLFLEIFVGFIQAFIFATLTLVFIAIATTEHEH